MSLQDMVDALISTMATFFASTEDVISGSNTEGRSQNQIHAGGSSDAFSTGV